MDPQIPRLARDMWKRFGMPTGEADSGTEEEFNVGKDLAAQTAGSAHGPWRLSNSPALTIALPNTYFASLGLMPLVVN